MLSFIPSIPKSFNAEAFSSLYLSKSMCILGPYKLFYEILNLKRFKINKHGVFTIPYVRGVSMNVKIWYKFIEIENSASYRRVILTTNDWRFLIFKIIRYWWSYGSVIKDTG